MKTLNCMKKLKIRKKIYILATKKRKKQLMIMLKFISKIRNEYALLQKENNQLKIQLQKYQNYIESLPQKSYRKQIENRIRKRKHYYCDDDYEDSEESDSYVTEIGRRPKKQKRENNL